MGQRIKGIVVGVTPGLRTAEVVILQGSARIVVVVPRSVPESLGLAFGDQVAVEVQACGVRLEKIPFAPDPPG